MAAALVIFSQTFPAGAVEKDAAAEAPPSAELLDFDACARLAIRQSPFLTKSSLEIDVKRMDESDSRYSFIPSVNFRTTYYVDRPSGPGISSKPYTLSFSSEGYNPFEAYFSLQVRKLVTTLVIYGHLQVIADGLYRIGKMFLELDALKKVDACQEEFLKVARENLDYAEKRQKIGTGTTLEIKVATQELDLAQGEKERVALAQKRNLESLKAFLGLKADQNLALNLKEVQRQVFGQFDPIAVTTAQMRDRSYELKMQDIKKQLQKFNIMLAKTRVLPVFIFGVQTPDPLSVTTAHGLYFWVGVEVPVWDGFKRLRNISRQKTVMKQYEAETEAKEIDISNKLLSGQEEIKVTHVARNMALSQEELTRLKARQGEIRYQSGGEPLSVYLEAQKANLEAKKNAILKSLDYDLAVLGMRHQTGDLSSSYVEISAWQK